MEPPPTIVSFKNLQGYGNFNVTTAPGVPIFSIIKLIAERNSLAANQIDMVTVTLEPGAPLSVLALNSTFPSVSEITSTIYYYFVKPQQLSSQFPTTTHNIIQAPMVNVSSIFPTTTRSRRKTRQPPRQHFEGIVFTTPPTTPPRPPEPYSPPGTRKGKEKRIELPRTSIIQTPQIKIPLQPLASTLNPGVWNNQFIIGKLQSLSRTVEFLRSDKPFISTEFAIYYHSDQEKTLIDRLGKPYLVERGSTSAAMGESSEIRYYYAQIHGIIVPLKIWLVRTTGSENTDPILTHPELPNYLHRILKISFSPDNNATELTPSDYSVENFYTSILWLIVNQLTFQPGSPGSPPSYAPSPPGSPSGGPPPVVISPFKSQFTTLS